MFVCHGIPCLLDTEYTHSIHTLPQYTVAVSRHATYGERPHNPTPWGLALGRWVTAAKVSAVAYLLEWAGQARDARALRGGFRAFCVQNSPRYSRSIVSRVDAAIALRAKLDDTCAADWPLVWDKAGGGDWDSYGYAFFSGVRALLFRQAAKPPVCTICHAFAPRQGANTQDTAALRAALARGAVAATAAGAGNDGDAASVHAHETPPPVALLLPPGNKTSGARAPLEIMVNATARCH